MKRKNKLNYKLLYCHSQDGCTLKVRCWYNKRTDSIGFGSSFYSSSQRNVRTKTLYSHSREGCYVLCRVNIDTGYVSVHTGPIVWRGPDGGGSTNPKCSVYLGVYVAERILADVFNNVERMPNGNTGFDFICGKGYKIDVKSACLGEKSNHWQFQIRQNTIADYFLLLAFDNRNDLNPVHLWLIPGHVLNHQKGTSIAVSTLDRWSEYELTDKLDKVIKCCNTKR